MNSSRTVTDRRMPAPRRRGVMLPMVMVLLPVLVIFLGFSVDVAYMQVTRAELRAATDAASRAAATELAATDSEAGARAEAIRVAKANTVAGTPLDLAVGDIEIGRSVETQSGRWVFGAGAARPNAVRITGGNTAGVPLFFGSLIGVSDFQPRIISTASFVNVDICLVLDRSTSMKTDVDSSVSWMYVSDPLFCQPPGPATRWAALDSAVKVFTDTLRQSNGQEQVAIASYSSAFDPAIYCGTSTVPASLDQTLTTDLSRIDSQINSLSGAVWNGNTDIESGMLRGIDALTDTSHARASADRYMIVMTDGNQNVGNAENAADLADAEGIRVHTITFSVDANQDLMRSVASRARGRHLHANTAEELKDAFRELAAVAAQLTD